MEQVPVSKHIVNVAIKFLIFTVVLSFLLPTMSAAANRYTFGGVIWVAAFLTVLAYVVGDLWVLPNFGNWVAVGADAGLVILGLWMLPGILGTPPVTFTTMVMAALLLGVAEFYFHRYLGGALMTNPVASEGGDDTSNPERNQSDQGGGTGSDR